MFDGRWVVGRGLGKKRLLKFGRGRKNGERKTGGFIYIRKENVAQIHSDSNQQSLLLL